MNKKAELSASEIYKLMNDPFWIWCQLHAPKEEAIEIKDRHLDLLFEKGKIFEQNWVQKNYPNFIRVTPEYGEEAINRTIELMMIGIDVIYQPFFRSESEYLKGKGDLLIKDTTHKSKFGDYHYRIEEIKNSKEVKTYHKLQTACYNFILSSIQGYLPEKITIILEDKKEIVDYKKIEKEFKKYVQLWRDIRDEKVIPLPSGIDKTDTPWRDYANKILLQSNDITLLPGVGKAYRAIIKQAFGISSITELGGINEKVLVEFFDSSIGTSIYNHVQAYNLKKYIPINKIINKNETNKRVFYFDFETSDDVHPSEQPHIYLIGVCDKKNNSFKFFLGQGKKDEEKIFSEFLDYIGNLNDVLLYHWSDYEIGEIDEIIKQYPKLASRLTKIKNACVDLKEVVRNNFYIPVPTYSIKKVAPFLGFSWRQKDVNAFESMVLYWDWLKNPDQKIIQKVLDYNEDDCVAMAYIDKKLFNGY